MSNMDKPSSPDAANVQDQREELLDKIERTLQQRPESQRLIVGIAGPPASGKSTLAEWLVSRINSDSEEADRAVVVPMDGYHLDNQILDMRGQRAVKGAPQTFDAVGFLSLIERLSTQASRSAQKGMSDNDSASSIYIPVFDRTMDLSRCAGSSVEPYHQIVILEGNYLLLKQPIWSDISRFIDLSIFLDVPEPILEHRLIQRWLSHGLTPEQARERAQLNDIPNAHAVTRGSTTAHVNIKSVRQ